jgi:hypothetical protein
VLLSACFLLAGLGAISKTFAARIGSPHPLPSTSSALSLKTVSHPILARHADSTSKEISPGASHSCRGTRETLVQTGPREMEIGPRLDRPAAMYSSTDRTFLRPAKDSACLFGRRLRNIPATEPQSVSCVSTQRNPECWRVEKNQQYENI